jgi:hypothetical protein
MSSTSLARNTFGIDYKDIRSSHLEARNLSYLDLQNGILYESADRCKPYILLTDYKLVKAIQDSPNAPIPAILSFQYRTTGYYVVARKFKTKEEMEELIKKEAK